MGDGENSACYKRVRSLSYGVSFLSLSLPASMAHTGRNHSCSAKSRFSPRARVRVQSAFRGSSLSFYAASPLFPASGG